MAADEPCGRARTFSPEAVAAVADNDSPEELPERDERRMREHNTRIDTPEQREPLHRHERAETPETADITQTNGQEAIVSRGSDETGAAGELPVEPAESEAVAIALITPRESDERAAMR